MNSFQNLISQQKSFYHLNTSIKSLDQKIFNINQNNDQERIEKVFDFQYAPGCTILYSVLIKIIISHLKESDDNKVVLIDTLNPFPIHLLINHFDFEKKWIFNNIKKFTADTLSRVYSIFLFDQIEIEKNSATIVIINDFHEMVEMYEYEMFFTFEDTILKKEIESNYIFLKNGKRCEIEGSEVEKKDNEKKSDIKIESFYDKFDLHIYSLLNSITNFLNYSDLLCFLVGTLNTKFQNDNSEENIMEKKKKRLSIDEFENFVHQNGYVCLSPSLKGKNILKKFSPSQFKDINQDDKEDDDKSYALNNFVSTRCIFFKDWYHNSPRFYNEYFFTNNRDDNSKNKLRLTNAIKIETMGSQKKESDIIYFDYNNLSVNDEEKNTRFSFNFEFVDLSASDCKFIIEND